MYPRSDVGRSKESRQYFTARDTGYVSLWKVRRAALWRGKYCSMHSSAETGCILARVAPSCPFSPRVSGATYPLDTKAKVRGTSMY